MGHITNRFESAKHFLIETLSEKRNIFSMLEWKFSRQAECVNNVLIIIYFMHHYIWIAQCFVTATKL